jgi:DNA polymerase III alpha subunit
MENEMAMRYKRQLDDRIYTEEELEALPQHPPRSGKKHGNWCACVRCKAAACVVGGEVVNLKKIVTKNDDDMAFIDVVYEANQYRCTLFPKAYKEYEYLLELQTMFLISGYKDDRGQVVVLEMADVFSVADEQGWEKEVDLAHATH